MIVHLFPQNSTRKGDAVSQVSQWNCSQLNVLLDLFSSTLYWWYDEHQLMIDQKLEVMRQMITLAAQSLIIDMEKGILFR